MIENKTKVLYFFCFLIVGINSQIQRDRICTTSKFVGQCEQLQRGNSEVACVRVQDSIECAQRIMNGTAEFGVFTAENAFHVGALGWEGLTVIKEVRHSERIRENYDYQSVVVVRKSHTGGIDNLDGLDYCHPGLHYNRQQRWSERFLKHFERSVVRYNCTIDGNSPAEIEASALARTFNAACRPGMWSNNIQEDSELKMKLPRLCSLCDNPVNCTYEASVSTSSHRQALECMKKSSNALTYVALQEAQEFFQLYPNIASKFSYLCRNGSYESITDSATPCVWLSQPWKLLVTSSEKAVSIAQRMIGWMDRASQMDGWESALREILTQDSHTIRPAVAMVTVRDYVSRTRSIPSGSEMCNTSVKWCTKSDAEKMKCDVLRTAAITTGIYPIIECRDPRSDSVSCISDVSSGKADLVGIDSNYGYLARHPYNLTAALFEETEQSKYSSVVIVVKEDSRINGFDDFKNSRACFPEFGGIASIAFINVLKSRGIVKRDECNFGQLFGSYFSQSCFPGSKNIFHDPSASNPDTLCNLCQTKAMALSTTTKRPKTQRDGEEDYPADVVEGAEADVEETVEFVVNRSVDCAASESNRFYGTRGALACLNEVGDLAVLELQNLNDHVEFLNLNAHNFRVVCRNGSLAEHTGFNVDSECALTTIIDGEIVVRRSSSRNPGIINVLSSLDRYLQTDPDFKMYNIFAGEKNLLFEDSSLGLVSPNDSSLSNSVQNYIKLFEDVENCIDESGSALTISVNLLLTLSLVLFTFLIRM